MQEWLGGRLLHVEKWSAIISAAIIADNLELEQARKKVMTILGGRIGG